MNRTIFAGLCSSVFVIGLGYPSIAHADLFANSGLEIGVYQFGAWSLDSNHDQAWEPALDSRFNFGGALLDVPLTIHIQNVSLCDSITVFNQGFWSIDSNCNGRWDGPSLDAQFRFGNSGDIPVAGISNGPGPVLAVYNGGTWSIDANNNHQWDGVNGGDEQFTFGGYPGDLPVVGNWNGSTQNGNCLGIYNNGVWSLDFNCNGRWDGVSGGDKQFTFGGSSGDQPVVGNWTTHFGPYCVGVFNNGTWSLDLNCNGVWDGPFNGDAQFVFGSTGDSPIVTAGNDTR